MKINDLFSIAIQISSRYKGIMSLCKFFFFVLLLASLMNVPFCRAQLDLTNENSPGAAMFKDGQSYTRLAHPSGVGPAVGLKIIAEGLTAPMTLVGPADGTGRLFIVDQTGIIQVLEKNSTVLKVPLLDVSGKMVRLSSGYDERGLLGLALHPSFEKNGRLFVYYSTPLRSGVPFGFDHTNRLSEFKISSDPNRANTDSEKVLLEVDVPYSNHNGGQIRFGPDGYLYIPTGDGGGADDVGNGHTPNTGNGQDLKKPLGKVLRIDVDNTSSGRPYGIPGDNPFLENNSALPEIYAYGLRNPAFTSFDGGRMFVADAGQNLFEEIDIILKGGDYSWNIREGTHCFDPSSPDQPQERCRTTGYRGEPLIGPVIELGHDTGSVIIGGFVYRGKALPDLQGSYIFGDWSAGTANNGTLLVAKPPAGWNITMLTKSSENLKHEDIRMWNVSAVKVTTNANGQVNANIRGFGEDADHELYVMTSQVSGPAGTTGAVYKIVRG